VSGNDSFAQKFNAAKPKCFAAPVSRAVILRACAFAAAMQPAATLKHSKPESEHA